MNIAEKLINFRDIGDANFLDLPEKEDNKDLLVIVTEVLTWLKLQRKRELWIENGKKISLKPLQINKECSWREKLIEILKEENSLSEVFNIDNNTLDFKDTVPEEYVKEVRLIAYENYNPLIIMN